jgi:hypothetical protein
MKQQREDAHGRRAQTRQESPDLGHLHVVEEGDGGAGFEVTCVEGEHFPPTGSGNGAHYELVHAATHSHKHSELGSGDK